MSDIKVSIIIPVYDVANYLCRCLDSCVNQTLPEIEIILVNDCSPDPRDTEIMKEYEKKFPDKVRCVWHESNKSQGAARNTGIRSARGEFIYCLDSDDYIDLELCEKMYNVLVEENADMAVCDTVRIQGNQHIKNWKPNGIFNTSDLCERLRNFKNQAPWTIIIKKSVIDGNEDLFFPEYMRYQDAICVLWCLASGKIVRIKEALHYYCTRSNSVIQAGTLNGYIAAINVIKYILNSAFFHNLDVAARGLLVPYLFQYTPGWCQAVCLNYPDEFIRFCRSILDILKSYRIDYDSDRADDVYAWGDGIYARKVLCFIEENIDVPNFNIEFFAYRESCYAQHKRIAELKEIRSLFPLYPGKRLTLWGCGAMGKRIAENMSVNGLKFEMTDKNADIHGNRITRHSVIRIKPWDELKEHTDIVLVTADGIYEDVRERLAEENPDIDVVDFIALLKK